ncbi:MAG: hypothetical protein Q9227_006203 [Pyrenula ochraceoflavens]
MSGTLNKKSSRSKNAELHPIAVETASTRLGPRKEPDCKICHSEMTASQATRTHLHPTCLVTFHHECIQTWIESLRESKKDKLTCPNCRRTVPDLDEAQNQLSRLSEKKLEREFFHVVPKCMKTCGQSSIADVEVAYYAATLAEAFQNATIFANGRATVGGLMQNLVGLIQTHIAIATHQEVKSLAMLYEGLVSPRFVSDSHRHKCRHCGSPAVTGLSLWKIFEPTFFKLNTGKGFRDDINILDLSLASCENFNHFWAIISSQYLVPLRAEGEQVIRIALEFDRDDSSYHLFLPSALHWLTINTLRVYRAHETDTKLEPTYDPVPIPEQFCKQLLPTWSFPDQPGRGFNRVAFWIKRLRALAMNPRLPRILRSRCRYAADKLSKVRVAEMSRRVQETTPASPTGDKAFKPDLPEDVVELCRSWAELSVSLPRRSPSGNAGLVPKQARTHCQNCWRRA